MDHTLARVSTDDVPKAWQLLTSFQVVNHRMTVETEGQQGQRREDRQDNA